MNTKIINIIGVIGGELGIDGDQVCSYSDVLMQLNEAKDADLLEIHINSIGGYCYIADNIIKAIQNTKKQIITRNTGDVASAATRIFTIPSNIANRIFNPALGVFLVHNPWSENVSGDADTMAEQAKILKGLESDYEKWYSEKIGADKEIISELMAQDTPLTTEQIERFGFATIEKPKFQAFAKIQKSNKMNEKEINEKLSLLDKAIAKMQKLFPKAIMLADATGAELEFPDANTPEEVVPGVKTSAADGYYVMPSGETYVIAGGILTEIIAAEGDDMEALKAENESLKSELEALKAEKATAETQIAEFAKMGDELKDLKTSLAAFSKYKAPNPTPTPKPDGKQSRVAAKSKRK